MKLGLKNLGLKYTFLWALLVVVGGCASSLKAKLQKVEAGMDKSDVLDLVGNPSGTKRRGGYDVWIYEVDPEKKETRTEILFDGGRVAKVQSEKDAAQDNDLQKANSMEEFERAVETSRKKNKKQ